MPQITFEPKKMTQIITILTDWVLHDKYEYDVCRSKLQDIAIDEDDADWLMETVNFQGILHHDIETYLTEQIDVYNIHHMDEDVYGCGHDRYLSLL